jgi:hypothetical protein
LPDASRSIAFVRFDEYRNVVVHETTDPEVIIVEYEAHGTVVLMSERRAVRRG